MSIKLVLSIFLCIAATSLSGCSSGSNGAAVASSPSPSPTPSPTPSISITGVSSSSPMALTSISISTAGLNTGQAVVVQLSNGSGFSATLTPMRVQSDGTVVVAMPLFVDPTNGATGSVNVALTIGQGGLTSSPVNLTIQDIPSLSNYQINGGPVTLGQISRAFFNYQILSLGRMVDGLQSTKSMPGNKVDISVPLANAQQQLINIIEARSDIDRIITTNSLQIGSGTLPNGTNMTFDQNSVTIMDRVLAVYLQNIIQPALPSPLAKRAHSGTHSSSNVVDLTSIFNAIEGSSNLENIVGSVRGFAQSNSTFADKLVAVGSGLVATAGIVGLVGGSEVIVAGAAVAGLVVTAVAVANDVYHVASDYVDVLELSNDGASPAQLAQAQTNLKNSEVNLGLDALGGALGGLGTVAEDVGKMGIQGAGFVLSTVQLYVQNQQINDQQTAAAAAGQISSPFPSPTQGFGTIGGVVNISNTQGPILSGLTEIEALDPVSGTQFSVMADESGNYQILIPLGDSSINYSSLTIEAVDPVSGLVLSSETINLSGLTSSSTPFPIPLLSGVCNDSDAGDPDSDDPDCD